MRGVGARHAASVRPVSVQSPCYPTPPPDVCRGPSPSGPQPSRRRAARARGLTSTDIVQLAMSIVGVRVTRYKEGPGRADRVGSGRVRVGPVSGFVADGAIDWQPTDQCL